MVYLISILKSYDFDLDSPPKRKYKRFHLGALFHEIGHALDLIVTGKPERVLQTDFGFKSFGRHNTYPEWLIKAEARTCAYALMCETKFTSGIAYSLGNVDTDGFAWVFSPLNMNYFRELVQEYRQELEPGFYPAVLTLRRIVNDFTSENEGRDQAGQAKHASIIRNGG